MYPRNAASPERVAIGAVIQISDGAVQTSGVTVRVRGQGGAEGDGGGTTVYSTDGIVEYTPTQAETNYTSFILIAKKTGCIPVSVTVVTTAAGTAGKVDVGAVGGQTASATGAVDFDDLATIESSTTTNLDAAISSRMATYTQPTGFLAATFPTTVASTTNITGGTITTVTNVTNLPAAAQASIDAIEADTNELQTNQGNWLTATGFSTHDAAAVVTAMASGSVATVTGNVDGSVGSVTGAVGSVTGNVGGNVTGSVGSVVGHTVQTGDNYGLLTGAHTEPTGVPAANETPIDKIAYLYMGLRNQIDVTATDKTFYGDDGLAEWKKALSEDGTTYSEGEAATP